MTVESPVVPASQLPFRGGGGGGSERAHAILAAESQSQVKLLLANLVPCSSFCLEQDI
jgi:hypothetical protein